VSGRDESAHRRSPTCIHSFTYYKQHTTNVMLSYILSMRFVFILVYNCGLTVRNKRIRYFILCYVMLCCVMLCTITREQWKICTYTRIRTMKTQKNNNKHKSNFNTQNTLALAMLKTRIDRVIIPIWKGNGENDWWCSFRVTTGSWQLRPLGLRDLSLSLLGVVAGCDTHGIHVTSRIPSQVHANLSE